MEVDEKSSTFEEKLIKFDLKSQTIRECLEIRGLKTNLVQKKTKKWKNSCPPPDVSNLGQNVQSPLK